MQETSQKNNALRRAFMAVPIGRVDAVRKRMEALGVPKSTYLRDLRTGANNIPSERLSYWADALGTSMSDLMDEPSPRSPRAGTRGAQAAEDIAKKLSSAH